MNRIALFIASGKMMDRRGLKTAQAARVINNTTATGVTWHEPQDNGAPPSPAVHTRKIVSDLMGLGLVRSLSCSQFYKVLWRDTTNVWRLESYYNQNGTKLKKLMKNLHFLGSPQKWLHKIGNASAHSVFVCSIIGCCVLILCSPTSAHGVFVSIGCSYFDCVLH